MPFQQQYAPGQRSFKNLGSAPPDERVPPHERMPVPPAFRHRVGRGGRRHLDRRFPPFTKAPLASRPHPAPFSTKTAAAAAFSNPPPGGAAKPTSMPFFLAFPHARFWPLLRMARRAMERMGYIIRSGGGCKKPRRWIARGRLRSGGNSMGMGRGWAMSRIGSLSMTSISSECGLSFSEVLQ
jgi:hypothetical protein